MLQSGLSTRRVAAIFGVAYSTMSRLLIRFDATNSVNDRRWSGRPKATTHRQDNLIRTLTLRNPTITARALQGQLRTAAGVTVSDQTIQNRLHAAGLRARRLVVRIPLTQRHRIHRSDWCRRHLQWNGLQWSRVAFSDDSRFNLYFNDGQMRVYRRRGERYSDVNVKELDRYGGGSVMVWAAVTMHRRTPLRFIAGNLNLQRYVDDVMRPMVLPFLRQIGQGAVFQDDNARPHRGHIVNDFVLVNNINRMDWPANSPDLNPIENMRDELGRRTYRDNPPQTIPQLRHRLAQEWQNIPQATIRRCVGSMRKRYQECVNARGGHTSY